ncbi:MAG: hypothetical protein FDX30_01160 [Chlorobium sp.]|nr:MAG: hypothetical protein FDX30_01160 [Chlorobium sp.]
MEISMKKYSFPLIFLLSFFLITGCADNPRSTAQKFSENLAEGKITEAKKFATEPTGKMLDFAASLGTLPVNQNYKFIFIRENVQDNSAQVVYKESPDGQEQTIDMVKIDGKWKVNMQTRK